MKNFYFNYYTVVLVLLANLIGFSNTYAQSVKIVNSGARINVASNTFLKVQDFVVKDDGSGNDGQLTNAGTISVNGDWSNNNAGGGGGFSSNAGTVEMDGSTNQNINGTAETRFNNLTFTTGSATKTLGVNTTVGGGFASPTGILTLNNSTLILNSRTLTITNGNANAISNSGGFIRSETSGTYGILRWNIGTNTGNYIAPFGTAANGNVNFEYNIDNAAGIGAGAVNFSTYPTPNSNLPLPNGVTHLTDNTNVNNSSTVYNRFWSIAPTGYSTLPKGKYVFHYLNAETDGAVEANLRAQRFNPTAIPSSPGNNGQWGDWLYSPAPNTTSKTITLIIQNTLDYFDTWTLADNANPLPIELVRFSAKCENGKVDLTWVTASEINVSHYEVERTNDGVHFSKVSEVVAVGFSNNMHTYTSEDNTPYIGTSYYRLKTVDLDGSYEYSELISTGCAAEGAVSFNFQNAYLLENGNLNLLFTANEADNFDAAFYDMSGKLISKLQGKASFNGNNQEKMILNELAPGIYVINMVNNERVFSKKIFID